jgi:hypothetical protein
MELVSKRVPVDRCMTPNCMRSQLMPAMSTKSRQTIYGKHSERQRRHWAFSVPLPLNLGVAAHEPQFFRRQGPIDGALGFRHRLSFGDGLTSEGPPFEREPPFPKLSLDALNHGVFDVAIFQLQSSSRSRRTARSYPAFLRP